MSDQAFWARLDERISKALRAIDRIEAERRERSVSMAASVGVN
ncbi:MAG: hypothetical protein AB1898_22350 [Acidobacteriota bacterium]